ncbi:RIKEN cDNA D730001G18, isoform CRA_a, partial [Mus musculus]
QLLVDIHDEAPPGAVAVGCCVCFSGQSWWHPGHEVLRPNLPQQHRVFRWPCPLCLLLSGEPVQPQCCLRPDRQPWGYMGQRLYQPTVGTASSCLVRAWVAFPYHRGSVCNLSSILPRPSPGCYSLSHH